MDTLRYNSPAKKWIDALPLGNGIMGAMVYGGVKKERIAFNNSTLWSGYPKDHDNPQSLENLAKVREMVFGGQNHLADKLCEEKLDGDYSEGYLPLGYLDISFWGVKRKDYERKLDISKAIFSLKTGSSERESFVSYPDNVFVYKVCSSTPFSARITSSSKLSSSVTYGTNIVLTGQAPDHVKPKYLGPVPNAVEYTDLKGMAFALVSKIETDGEVSYTKAGYSVQNATTLIIFSTTETGYNGYDKMPETRASILLERCQARLENLSSYEEIRDRHLADYTALWNRHSLKVACDDGKPTLYHYYKAKLNKITPELLSLFYNYGKYLTIAGSRKGGSALNLQGLWNDDIRPPWSSNYTTNINAEMNYWPTSQIGLTECLTPYYDLIKGLSSRGCATAKTNYGGEGFTVNHNTDIWCKTAPVKGNPQYMFAPLCGAWLVNELMEHFAYGEMEDKREEIEKIVTGNVEFILSYLVEHDGYLVTCPSASPENTFIKDGRRCYLDFASAFDMGIVRQSLNDYLALLPNGSLANKVKEVLPRLYPFKEDIDGIVEWANYYPTPEVGHRHFSPLYAFHPARSIGYYSHPEEREWVRRLFHTRIFNVKYYYGWSGAWALALSARLREKDNVKLVISRVLGKAIFKNLFDMHPPKLFQIDGNFGFVHGINEMLCQMENDTLELLPALCDLLPNGEIKGQRLPGGYKIDFKWENGKITRLVSNEKNIKVLNVNLAHNVELVNATLVEKGV